MPLVAYKNIPSFDRLARDGHLILSEDRALRQDYRGLHIGLLNMMPDAAMEITERQFFRLIGRSDRIVQFYMHPFTIDGIERSDDAQDYIKRYYESFEDIKKIGLDALIITGANVKTTELNDTDFYATLREVLEWASENVTSTLCSCLATHAVMQAIFDEKRQPLEQKLWGVYKHKVLDEHQPLTRGINTAFYAPHSRNNKIDKAQFLKHDMHVLVESPEAGVHLASSEDGLRLICFQGHPEYDRISLFKEYKRELDRFIKGKITQPPPLPEHYFLPEHSDEMQRFVRQAISERNIEVLDETTIAPFIDNTWQDTARSIIQNWVGAIYQLTGYDRHEPFMDCIDPNDPMKNVLI
jgi:homoserine O-succinyltransferase